MGTASSKVKEGELKFKVKIITLSDDENGEEGFTNIVINEDEIKPQHKLPPYSRSCSMETDGITRHVIPNITIPRPPSNTFLLAFKSSFISFIPRNIIVLGQTGAGKSSTICHLLGQGLPKNPSSTDLIKVNPGVYWQSKGTKRLRRVTNKDEIDCFKRSVVIGTGKSSALTHADLMHQTSQKHRAASTPQSNPANNETFGSLFIEDVKMAVTKEVTNADLKGLSLPTQQNTMPLYQIIDCGGMPFFRNLLPQFFPSAENTIFFIVHKLTDKLYENAQVRVLQRGRLVHQAELPRKNIDEIQDWVKIAHSCSVPLAIDSHVGNTFMIGTHFDHLQRKCFNNEPLALEAAFTATEHICERVISDPSHPVLDPKPIFLKNDLAGTEKCPGIQMLRKKLWMYKLPSSKPVELPALWCVLIKHIRELAEESKKPILPLEDYFKIAKSYSISQTDAWTVLSKCKEHCVVFHLTNASYLNKYIFIDMQWLFTSLANILHRPDSYCKGGQHYSDWKEVTETGFMSVSFHAHLFYHTPKIDCLPSTWASDLLEQLHLMSRVSVQRGDGFFCPILLPLSSDHNTQCDPFHKEMESDALHIIPQNQSIPPGYLARLFALISSIPNKVKLVYCTSQTAATFQLFTDNPNESYFLRISEDRGGIRLEFCSAFPECMAPLRACSIANRILLMVIHSSDVLQKTWRLIPALDCPVILQDSKAKDFPTLFVKCHNKKCCVSSYHLSRVHPQPLNKSKPYVQCSLNQNRMFFSDLPTSQIIWLMKLVEDRVEVSHLERCISKVEKGDRVIQTYPIRHPTPMAASENALTVNRVWPHQANQVSRLMFMERAVISDEYLLQPHLHMPKTNQRSDFILDSCFILLEDHLDLDICNYLFQFGVLNNDERTRILALNASVDVSSPVSRAHAISVLLDVLRANRVDAFMAFVTALELTMDTDSIISGHRIILDHLQKDSSFMKIKKSWLSSLTVHD